LYANVIEEITPKQCSRCENFLPQSAFYKRSDTKSGFRSHCKACINKPELVKLDSNVVEEITSKQCTKCEQILPRSAFGADLRNNSGLKSQCKACCGKAVAKWKEKNKEKSKQWRKENQDKLKNGLKKHRKTDKYKKRKNKYVREKRALDPKFKMLCILRGRLVDALRGKAKADTTKKMLGCDLQFFKNFIQAKFKPGMNWQNHGSGDGKWQLDHIQPCSSFDLSDFEQQKKCFHYTNMQPLWAYENLQKSNKLDWKPADANA